MLQNATEFIEHLPGVFLRAAPDATLKISNHQIKPGARVRIDIGQGSSLVLRSLVVGGDAEIEIGQKSNVRGLTLGMKGPDARLVIGDRFRCGPTHIVAKYTDISIGSNVLFSHGITIRTTDMHSIFDKATGERINPPASVRIEDHVWIGQDVIVGKGASIGADSVVAARSFVSKAFPPESLIGGSPAKVLRDGVTWSHEDGPC